MTAKKETEFDATIAQIQEQFMSLAPPEEVWSEELIQQRRLEAQMEEKNE